MSSVRERLVRGLLSGLVHEAFSVVLSFGAMLVLVRLLTPTDYGQAAVVAGVFALVRGFSGALFVEHALQHGKEVEPDWSTYFAIVGVVQFSLFAVTNVIAVACRMSGFLADVSYLLHIAAIGLLFDWPAQIASVKLRRELRVGRLKLLTAVSQAANLTSAIVLAWSGFGAAALVISGNVVSAIPMALSFFFVEKFRPGKWLYLPSARDRRPIVQFARQQMAAGLLHSIRAAAESLVLTRMFGVATLGLINRALVLFTSTVGRLCLVFLDTAYPVLPMERADRSRYASRAARFVEVALILSVPGAAFLAIEGANVSRLLYGDTWSGADGFLAPAAVALAASTLATAASYVLMGFGKVQKSVIVEGVVACGGLAALVSTAFATAPTTYMWALAGAQVTAAVVAFVMAAPCMDGEWRRRGLWPAGAASIAGVIVVMVLRSTVPLNGAAGLVMVALGYAVAVLVVIASTAPAVVSEIMNAQRLLPWRRALPGDAVALEARAKA